MTHSVFSCPTVKGDTEVDQATRTLSPSLALLKRVHTENMFLSQYSIF